MQVVLLSGAPSSPSFGSECLELGAKRVVLVSRCSGEPVPPWRRLFSGPLFLFLFLVHILCVSFSFSVLGWRVGFSFIWFEVEGVLICLGCALVS